uniref:Uncharacterized protein n=1 Tax=Salix viminalis TaxID=40686 RepID=A0A6N2KX23_SALVM
MFIKEVLKTLDPKFKRRKKGAQKARHLLESRARKFFLDNIASKINSDEAEEKMQGLNMLRNMTNDIQHQILVKLHKKMEKCPGYPWKLKLLITLASIHPSLINSSLCVKKFYSNAVCKELEIQKPVKNIAHAIRGYALRFLKYNSSPVPSLQEEVQKACSLQFPQLLWHYRLSIESHIMQSEKTHNSMQEEVDTSMYDTPADFGCHDNAYDDEDGETSAYYMHGVFEAASKENMTRRNGKFTKSPSAYMIWELIHLMDTRTAPQQMLIVDLVAGEKFAQKVEDGREGCRKR